KHTQHLSCFQRSILSTWLLCSTQGGYIFASGCAIPACILAIKCSKMLQNSPCPGCPDQWFGYRNSCYFFSKMKKDWNSSQATCSAEGSHLLVISDAKKMVKVCYDQQSGKDVAWEPFSILWPMSLSPPIVSFPLMRVSLAQLVSATERSCVGDTGSHLFVSSFTSRCQVGGTKLMTMRVFQAPGKQGKASWDSCLSKS
uniref:C-type lectin domain-containing protein n=1 Tax=Terrapene triunguis TaxID=2587831 RepID=A0A674IB27_9SAUR